MPNSAASLYKSKALLHWSGVTLNGGAIAAQGDDSVEVVAYFGDASGAANGSLSGGDASDISAVATGLGTNTAARHAERLLGVSPGRPGDHCRPQQRRPGGRLRRDFAQFGAVGHAACTDSVRFRRVCRSRPPAPTRSERARHFQAMPGGTVVVPVNIDTARPAGSTGMTEAILALRYDPQVFSVSPRTCSWDIDAHGWQLTTAVNPQTGEIGIDLFRQHADSDALPAAAW